MTHVLEDLIHKMEGRPPTKQKVRWVLGKNIYIYIYWYIYIHIYIYLNVYTHLQIIYVSYTPHSLSLLVAIPNTETA